GPRSFMNTKRDPVDWLPLKLAQFAQLIPLDRLDRVARLQMSRRLVPRDKLGSGSGAVATRHPARLSSSELECPSPSRPGGMDATELRRTVLAAMTRFGNMTAALLLVLPGAVWLLLFAVLPLAFLVVMSFWSSTIFGLSTEPTLDNYRTLLSEAVYLRVLLHTLRVAAITTLIALIVSYPMAYFLAMLKGRAK